MSSDFNRMHSRNSCKTLKCPRCNWHYKYQETLEIHMKEKHPENELSCLYCVTNQSHPRLARGETYTCGYKPYRCEVCNYSTTTKGNLSIHMTSDKHMTNIQQYDVSSAAALSAATAAAAANANNQNNNNTSLAASSSSASSSPASGVNSLVGSSAAASTATSQQQATTGANITPISSPTTATSTLSSTEQLQQAICGNHSAVTSSSNLAAAIAAATAAVNSATPTPTSNPLDPLTGDTNQNSGANNSNNGNNNAAANNNPGNNQQESGNQQQNAAAAVAAAILLAQQNPHAIEDYMNSPEIAKDNYDDPTRKFKCHRCKVAFTRQSYLTAHNKTLFHRKGEKLAYPMEKYLDPNRPFKCDICKESFTQKSILLVHNNSVSHLNKLRQNKKAAAGLEQQQQHQSSPEPQQQQQQQQQATSQTQMTPSQQNQQQHSLHQQANQQQNPLAALMAGAASDPMTTALMMGGGNPMAALMAGGAMPHPMMPFMMNPHLMAAAALAAAQTQRMLDPIGQQQPISSAGQSGPSASAGGNLFADFQSQQQQLMQHLAVAASGSGATGNPYSQLGNLLNPALAAELLQQSVASSIAPSTSVVGAMSGQTQNNMSAAHLMNPLLAMASGANNIGGAVSDANLVSSTLDSLHSRHQQSSQQQQSGLSKSVSNQQQSSNQSSNITGNQNNNKQNNNGIESSSAQQQAAAAAAAVAALSVQQQKRSRTRISEEQLSILRQHFDINNSPSEDQLQEMSIKTNLGIKVIKHWFRNNLFKERQKNKDSPYNFNNPPMLALNLEEYERTGEAKVTPISDLVTNSASASDFQQRTLLPKLAQSSTTTDSSYNPSSRILLKQQLEDTQSLNDETIEDSAAAVVDAVVNAVAIETGGDSSNKTPSSGRDFRASLAAAADMLKRNNSQPSSPNKRMKLEQQTASAATALESQIINSNLDQQSSFEREFVARVKLEMSRALGNPSSLAAAEDASQANLSDTNNNARNNNNDHLRCDSDGDSQGDASDSDTQANQDGRSRGRRLRRSPRNDKRKLSPLGDDNAGIGPSSTWSPLQLQQQLFDQTWASVNNHLSNQGLSSKTSDSSSHSINSSTNSKSKRANRTRFSDQQVKVLQEFFETNAYPKDDDLECLSKQLGLSPRVIVVWFQNARQKARKVHENRPCSASMSEGEDDLDSSMMHNSAQQQQQAFHSSSQLSGGHHQHANSRRQFSMRGLVSPSMSHGDGESSLGGTHSPTGSMGELNTSGSQQTSANQQQSASSQPLDDMYMSHLDNESNRGDDDAEHQPNQSHLDEGEDQDEDDDDEFMSAAQMMRHQQQQQQRQQAQQQQQQNQQLAAAAAGLFGGDASNLLSLIAANQQVSGLTGGAADVHQRSMLDALNNAMRGVNGASLAAQLGAAGNLDASGVSANSVPGGLSGLNDSSNASMGATSNMSDRNTSSSASQRDKRLRTQISPEQLDYLYQKYQIESNPSRKTLESIAQDVGLSKRVVQVWFQNTRARERRGQLRMSHVVMQQQRNQQQQQQQQQGSIAPKTTASQQQNGVVMPKTGGVHLPPTSGVGPNQNGDSASMKVEDTTNGGSSAAAAAAVAAQLQSLTGGNTAAAAAVAALMRGQLAGLEGAPGFAPLDLSGSKALFAGLNQLSALGVGLNFETQPSHNQLND